MNDDDEQAQDERPLNEPFPGELTETEAYFARCLGFAWITGPGQR